MTYEYLDAADVPKYGDNPAMASNGRGLRDVIKFEANVPVACSLKYRKAKIIETQRGPRAMFTLTVPSAVMFLDRDVAAKIEKLEITPGEVFWICRRNTGVKGELDMWDVYLDPATERSRNQPEPPIASPQRLPAVQADAALSNPIMPEKKGAQMAEAPGRSGITHTQDSQIHLGWARLTLSIANTLSDVYAAALAHAQQHGGSVRNEDVRTMVVTAFIQQCSRKGGPECA